MTMMKSNKTHSILVYLYFFLMTTFIASRRYVSRFSIIMTRLTILTTSFFIFGNDILPVLFSTYSSRTATTRTIYFILTTRFSPTSNTMVTGLGFTDAARGISWTILYSSSSTYRTLCTVTLTPFIPWIPCTSITAVFGFTSIGITIHSGSAVPLFTIGTTSTSLGPCTNVFTINFTGFNT